MAAIRYRSGYEVEDSRARAGIRSQAYKSGDIKALDAILDDAIVLVNDDGSIQTKAEFLGSVKASAPDPSAQQQQVAPEAFKVQVFGNVAIATGVMRVKGVEGGKPYTRRERFVDTWLFKHGTWVCVGTDATPVLHSLLAKTSHLSALPRQ